MTARRSTRPPHMIFRQTCLSRSDQTRFYVSPLARLVLEDDDIDGLSIEVGVDSYSGQTFMAHILTIGGEGDDEKTTPHA